MGAAIGDAARGIPLSGLPRVQKELKLPNLSAEDAWGDIKGHMSGPPNLPPGPWQSDPGCRPGCLGAERAHKGACALGTGAAHRALESRLSSCPQDDTARGSRCARSRWMTSATTSEASRARHPTGLSRGFSGTWLWLRTLVRATICAKPGFQDRTPAMTPGQHL